MRSAELDRSPDSSQEENMFRRLTRTTVMLLAGGAVRVKNSTGVLVARVDAGSSMSFEPQDAGAASPTRASGCLLVKAGKLIVVDQTTNVILEVQGTGLEKQTGNRVEIFGTAAKD